MILLVERRQEEQGDVVPADVAQGGDQILDGRVLALGPVAEQMPSRSRLLLNGPLFERSDAGRCVTCYEATSEDLVLPCQSKSREKKKKIDGRAGETYRDRGPALSSRDDLDGRSTWPPSHAAWPCRCPSDECLE